MVESLRVKHHSLTGRITFALMHAAFRAVKRNKGKAGVDRVSIEMYAQQLDQNLTSLMRDLKDGSFEPDPVLRKHIDNIPHDVVLRGLRNVVADGNILDLVEKFLTAGVMEDFVVLCRTERHAKEAQTQIEPFLRTIGLSLSPTKTKITTFLQGFTFLGFDVQSHSVKMRAKSVENFQTKVRDITTRSHNLDADVIVKLNSVTRGVQRYFGTWFSTCVTQFRELDEWVRMRLRCQKLKRQSRTQNCRIADAKLERMGLVTLSTLHRHSRQQVRGCSSHEAIPWPATSPRKGPRAAGPPGARKTHAGK